MVPEHFDVLVMGAGLSGIDASRSKQRSNRPWRVCQNYLRDALTLKWTRVDDEALEFSNLPLAASAPKSLELAEAGASLRNPI